MPDAHAAVPAAIVIAGGRGTRMGGIDKPGLELDGATLRERAIGAARAAGLEPIVHLGPEVDGGQDPALAAGLAGLGTEEVVVLAGDLVRPDLVIAALVGPQRTAPEGAGADGGGADGAVLVDPDGREQWLAARYRVAALRTALDALPGGTRDAALRAVTRGLDLRRVLVDAAVVADIDTWQDYETAKGQVDG